MQRERTGVYSETKETTLNGKPVSASFRVYRVRKQDPENPTEMVELDLWTWDCPYLKLPAQVPHLSKAEAIESMEASCLIGFTTMPTQTVALAVLPTAG